MTDIDQLPYVEAELNYLAPIAERPRYYAYEPEPGEPRSNLVPEPHRMQIHDAAPDRAATSGSTSRVSHFSNSAARSRISGMTTRSAGSTTRGRAFLAEATGASRVFIFDHLQRRRVPGQEDRSRSGPRQPATRVHVDHTARSGPQRVRDLMGEEAEELLKGRVQVINMWRPIREPLRDAPLAVCDSRTVAADDSFPRIWSIASGSARPIRSRYNPAHRWFYAPEMRRDEVLLLKIADTRTDISARFMPHTSFTDPTTPPDASRARASSCARWCSIRHRGFGRRHLADNWRTGLHPRNGPPRRAVRGGCNDRRELSVQCCA